MSELYLSFLKQGLAIGLAVSAPIGPTSIFCLQKAMTKGVVSGFFSSAGAATAQAFYAGIGAFSLNLASSSLFEYRSGFNLASGLFLCYLGIKIFLSSLNMSNIKPDMLPKQRSLKRMPLRDYGVALLLTSINPLAILPFIAFFTQIYSAKSYPNDTCVGMFAAGVFLSSVFWFGTLGASVNLFSRKILLRRLHWVNRISGIAIAVFGCVSIYSAWS